MILLNLSTHFSFSWLHGIWDLSSQARDQTLHWKHRVLTMGWQGNPHFSFSSLFNNWFLMASLSQVYCSDVAIHERKKQVKNKPKKNLTKQQCSHFFSSVTLEGEVLMCPCRLWWPGQQSTLRQPCWACSSRVVLIRLSVSPFSIFVFHQKLMFSNNQLSTESFSWFSLLH